jgi:hypothetical protein
VGGGGGGWPAGERADVPLMMSFGGSLWCPRLLRLLLSLLSSRRSFVAAKCVEELGTILA